MAKIQNRVLKSYQMQRANEAIAYSNQKQLVANLTPNRDLKKNWDTDIIRHLEEYMEMVFTEGTVDFISAARIIEWCSNVYNKKVDYLYKSFNETRQIFSGKRLAPQSPKRRNSQCQTNPVSDDFGLIDLSASGAHHESIEIRENEQNSWNDRRNPRNFHSVLISLLPIEDWEKSPICLKTYDGEGIGNKNEFVINTCSMSNLGQLHLPYISFEPCMNNLQQNEEIGGEMEFDELRDDETIVNALMDDETIVNALRDDEIVVNALRDDEIVVNAPNVDQNSPDTLLNPQPGPSSEHNYVAEECLDREERTANRKRKRRVLQKVPNRLLVKKIKLTDPINEFCNNAYFSRIPERDENELQNPVTVIFQDIFRKRPVSRLKRKRANRDEEQDDAVEILPPAKNKLNRFRNSSEDSSDVEVLRSARSAENSEIANRTESTRVNMTDSRMELDYINDSEEEANARNFGSRKEANAKNFGSQKKTNPENFDPREEANPENFDPREEANPENFDPREKANPENFDPREEANPENFDPRKEANPEIFDQIEEADAENYDHEQICDLRMEVGETPSAVGHPANDQFLEKMLIPRVDAYFRKAEAFEEKTELSERVKEWTMEIKNVLKQEEKKEPFEIDVFEDEVFNSFNQDTSKHELLFSELCKKKKKYEISRLFAAVLQLANSNNVDLQGTQNPHLEDVTLTFLSQRGRGVASHEHINFSAL